MVDYKLIKLENERSGHVEKKLNRLGAWQFFKVLYRDDMMKVFILNLFMLVFAVPLFLVWYYCSAQQGMMMDASLPLYNAVGFGSGVWQGVVEYASTQQAIIDNTTHLWLMPAMLGLAFAISGSFAMIRDSFWTGRLKVKPFFVGIGQTIGYTLLGTAILSVMYYGIFALKTFLMATIPVWVAVVILVIIYVAFVFTILYVLTFFGVVATYKQSLAQNMADSWRIMWLNILPNLIRLLIAVLPFVAYVLFQKVQFLTTIIVAFMMLMGLFYFSFCWMTHMMRTFMLFHPVEAKKKKASATALPDKQN